MIRKLITALLVLGFCATAQAAEPEDLIKYRKNVMKVIGGHTGSIFAIAGGKVDHKDAMMMHVKGLNEASKLVGGLFPEDSAIGETTVTQAVWDKPDEFAQAVKKLEMAASDLLQAAEAQDNAAMGPALKALGGSCKGCHDNFREKKK